jgi:hypothetical protein
VQAAYLVHLATEELAVVNKQLVLPVDQLGERQLGLPHQLTAVVVMMTDAYRDSALPHEVAVDMTEGDTPATPSVIHSTLPHEVVTDMAKGDTPATPSVITVPFLIKSRET